MGTPKTREVITQMTELVSVRLPSLVTPRVDSLNVKMSYKNDGLTKTSEKSVNAVKYLSSVEYSVDKETLKYLSEHGGLWQTPKIIPFEDLDGKSIKYAYKILRTNYQKHCEEMLILTLASLFQDCSFYFPLFLDWRGRFYTQSESFNYQGNKLALSLVRFKEKKTFSSAG